MTKLLLTGVILLLAATVRAGDEPIQITTSNGERVHARKSDKKYRGKEAYVWYIEAPDPGKPSSPIIIKGSVPHGVEGDILLLSDEPLTGGPPGQPRRITVHANGTFEFEVDPKNERRLWLESPSDGDVIFLLQPSPPKLTAKLGSAVYDAGWNLSKYFADSPAPAITEAPVVTLVIQGRRTEKLTVKVEPAAGGQRTLTILPSAEGAPAGETINEYLLLSPGVNAITLNNPAEANPERFQVEFREPAIFTPQLGLGPGEVFARSNQSLRIAGESQEALVNGKIRCVLGNSECSVTLSKHQFNGTIARFSEGDLIAYVPSPEVEPSSTWNPGVEEELEVARQRMRTLRPLVRLGVQPVSRMKGEQKPVSALQSALDNKGLAVNCPRLDVTSALHPKYPQPNGCTLSMRVALDGIPELAYTREFRFRNGKIEGTLNAGVSVATSLDALVVFPGRNQVSWTVAQDADKQVVDYGSFTVDCGPSADQQIWACMAWMEKMNDLDLWAQTEKGGEGGICATAPGDFSGAHLLVADTAGPGAELFVVPRGAAALNFLQLSTRLDSKSQHDSNRRPKVPCDVWIFVFKDQRRIVCEKLSMKLDLNPSMSVRFPLGEPVPLER